MKKWRYHAGHNYKDEYSRGKISRMKSNNPVITSDKRFFLNMHRFVYGQYCSNETFFGCDGYVHGSERTLEELRSYARGVQSVSKYQKLVEGSTHSSDPNSNESLLNISWSRVPVFTKVRDIMIGKISQTRFDYTTDVVDAEGRQEKSLKIGKLKAKVDPRIKMLAQQMGVGVNMEQDLPENTTSADIDDLEKIGGISLGVEIQIKDAIDLALSDSHWESNIREMLIEDLIDTSKAATHTYINKTNGRVYTEYVDISGLIFPRTRNTNTEDCQYKGFVRKMKIYEIRERYNVDEKELYKIAKKYKSNNSQKYPVNFNFNDIASRESYSQQNGGQVYDQFDVDVMTMYFIGGEVERALVNEDNIDHKFVKGDNIQYVYRSSWVVGSDCVFDYGKEYGQVRSGSKGFKKVELPIKIISLNKPSIVERCIGFIDDIHLATYKFRSLVASIPPGPRLAIDKSLVGDSVTFGNKTYSMMEMLEMYALKGVMIYESAGDWDIPNGQGSQRKPIDILSSGVAEDFSLFMELIKMNVDQIRNVTGINEFVDGSTNNPDILNGVLRGLDAATNNAMRPLYTGYKTIFELTIGHVHRKYKLAVLNGDISVEYLPFSSMSKKIINITKDIMPYEFGVYVKVGATDEERQLLLQDMVNMKNNNQITQDSYLVIYDMLKDGDYDKAKLFLSKAVANKEAMEEAKHLKGIQAQGAENAKVAQANLQAQAETSKITYDSMTKHEQEKLVGAEPFKEKEHLRELEKIKLQNQGSLEVKNADILDKNLDKEIKKEEKAHSA